MTELENLLRARVGTGPCVAGPWTVTYSKPRRVLNEEKVLAEHPELAKSVLDREARGRRRARQGARRLPEPLGARTLTVRREKEYVMGTWPGDDHFRQPWVQQIGKRCWLYGVGGIEGRHVWRRATAERRARQLAAELNDIHPTEYLPDSREGDTVSDVEVFKGRDARGEAITRLHHPTAISGADLEGQFRIATAIANATEAVPRSYRKQPGAVLLALAWSQQLELDILTTIQNVAFIEGKAVVDATMQRALAKRAGYEVWWMVEADRVTVAIYYRAAPSWATPRTPWPTPRKRASTRRTTGRRTVRTCWWRRPPPEPSDASHPTCCWACCPQTRSTNRSPMWSNSHRSRPKPRRLPLFTRQKTSAKPRRKRARSRPEARRKARRNRRRICRGTRTPTTSPRR